MSKHVFDPFEHLVEKIRNEKIAKWSAIEPDFMKVVEVFDAEYRVGGRSQGWYQSKARYFNNCIVGLLANRSGRSISMRTKKDSHLFGILDVDICYPDTGTPKIAGEVKALGTPPHPKNQNEPRDGSQDLHKRVREVAFTSTDLKVAYSDPKPIPSFQSWIDSTSPGYFSFWAIRANDEADFERARTLLSSLRRYCNGVGALIYAPVSLESPTSYLVRSPLNLDIDREIHEMAQRVA